MQALLEIEQLINRANYRGEFLEDELKQRLQVILNDPFKFPASQYNQLKRILFMITNIEKSSNFGYFFYETLHENPFPFCKDVLKSSVFNEQNYNLNDKALKSYVRTYMIDSGFDSRMVLDYDELVPEGHGYHYFESFTDIDKYVPSHEFNVKPCFYDIVYAVLNRDNFPMTQKKLSLILGLFNLKHFEEAIIGKSIQLLEDKKKNSDQILVLVHLFKLISILKKQNLPEKINDLITEVITCRCNGSLPKKFNAMSESFREHMYGHWDPLQITVQPS